MDSFDTLPEEVIFQIAQDLPLKDIGEFCLTNNRFNDLICNNQNFWRVRVEKDFSNMIELGTIQVHDWKEYYKHVFKHFAKVIVFGQNIFGRLGLKDTGELVSKPTTIPDIRAKFVAAGLFTAMIIDSNDDLWVNGDPFYKFDNILREERVVDFSEKIPNIKAKSVAVSGDHALIIDLADNVWVLGSNFSGELGLGNIDYTKEPKQLSDMKAIKVAVTFGISFIIDIENNLWVTGRVSELCGYSEEEGTPGNGYLPDTNVPIKVPNVKAVDVSVRFDTALIIDVEKNVWIFGYDGMVQPHSYTIPRIVPNIKALQVAADIRYGLILDTDHNVWSYGRQFMNNLLQVQNIKGSYVSASNSNVMIIDTDNNVFLSGPNNYGQLGNNSLNDSYDYYVWVQNIKARFGEVTGTYTILVV